MTAKRLLLSALIPALCLALTGCGATETEAAEIGPGDYINGCCIMEDPKLYYGTSWSEYIRVLSTGDDAASFAAQHFCDLRFNKKDPYRDMIVQKVIYDGSRDAWIVEMWDVFARKTDEGLIKWRIAMDARTAEVIGIW